LFHSTVFFHFTEQINDDDDDDDDDGLVHEGCWVHLPIKVGPWHLGRIDSLLRESARQIQLSGNQEAVDSVRCVLRSSGGPRAQSGGQAKKAPISS